MQNPTVKKPLPKSFIIDYKVDSPPPGYNPHFTVG